MGKFSEGVSRYAFKVQRHIEVSRRAIIIEMFSRVIQRTPVDTGRARGNWQISYGDIPTATATDDVLKGSAIEHVLSQLGTVQFGTTVWLSNNLPYIMALEYGEYPNPPKGGAGKTIGGYSKQAPNGMVRITALDFAAIVEETRG